ncbi:MAG: TonB-dependent receptor [Cytophagales bacterium]|nr:MAG: TonB-dependent receptor [Cytophagales bacterium]
MSCFVLFKIILPVLLLRLFTFMMLALSCISFAFAQKDSSQVNSLEGVVVYARPALAGFKTESLDSVALQRFQNQELSTVLTLQTPIFIKSYGAGSLATSAFRGMSSTHTQVYWNHLPLNSPMLGQIDFSLIPMAATDKIELLYGASALRFGNGGFGGGIHLQNTPLGNENKVEGSVRVSAGSFGSYKTALQSSIRGKKWSWQQKTFFRQLRNNFPYRFNGETFRQTNASVKQGGTVQEVYFQPQNRHLFALRLWQQGGLRELPPSILVNESSEKQEDNNLKIHAEYQYKGKVWEHKFWLAHTQDQLRYENSLIGQVSKSRVFTQQGQFLSAYQSPNLDLKWGVALAHERVQSSAYTRAVTQTRPQAHAELSWRIGGLTLSSILRQEVVDQTFMPMTGGLGALYFLHNSPKQHLSLSFQLARNSRFPTLNDRYWPISGNSELKAERGWSSEGQMAYVLNKIQEPEKPILKLSSTFYSSLVEDWIQWLPTVSGYWKPENVRLVWARGVELNTKVFTDLSQKQQLQYSLIYALNISQNRRAYAQGDESVGKQLIYTPLHTLKAQLSWFYAQKVNTFLLLQYTSQRLTASDGSAFLPSYTLLDWGLEWQMSSNVKWVCHLENFLDFQYQSIAFYPMYGRRLELMCLVKF